MGFFDSFFKTAAGVKSSSSLFFYNTLAKENQELSIPATAQHVRMYNCGPTVYGRQHIGNRSAAGHALGDDETWVKQWRGRLDARVYLPG